MNWRLTLGVTSISLLALLGFGCTSDQETPTITQPTVTVEQRQPTPEPTYAIIDFDGDGIEDFFDNCPNNDNPDQLDADTDGYGAECDPNGYSSSTTVLPIVPVIKTTTTPTTCQEALDAPLKIGIEASAAYDAASASAYSVYDAEMAAADAIVTAADVAYNAEDPDNPGYAVADDNAYAAAIVAHDAITITAWDTLNKTLEEAWDAYAATDSAEINEIFDKYDAAIIACGSSGERQGAICNDGWRSYSTGSGTCSWHGGVSYWLY